MSVEDERTAPETAEMVRARIIELVEKAEFGSAEYQAYCDYVDLENLQESWRIERGHMKSEKNDPDQQFTRESQLRVTDLQIALLENEIRHSRSHIKGYSNAYARIWLGFDSLGGATYDDARKKYPEDEKEQSRNANNRWNEIFNEVGNILAEKNG